VAVEAGAHIGPYSVIGHDSRIGEQAKLSGVIVWPQTTIGREARLTDTIVGRAGEIGRSTVMHGGVLGDRTSIAEYSRL
jgi:NDP-sugar pyrophosphorylase family protein